MTFQPDFKLFHGTAVTRTPFKKGSPRPTQPRLRVMLKSKDSRLLDIAAKRLAQEAEQSGAQVIGPDLIPTHITRLRSSSGHVLVRTGRRVLTILPSKDTMDALRDYDLPSGVEIEIQAEGKGAGSKTIKRAEGESGTVNTTTVLLVGAAILGLTFLLTRKSDQ